jgi:hypothetical protein
VQCSECGETQVVVPGISKDVEGGCLELDRLRKESGMSKQLSARETAAGAGYGMKDGSEFGRVGTIRQHAKCSRPLDVGCRAGEADPSQCLRAVPFAVVNRSQFRIERGIDGRSGLRAVKVIDTRVSDAEGKESGEACENKPDIGEWLHQRSKSMMSGLLRFVETAAPRGRTRVGVVRGRV